MKSFLRAIWAFLKNISIVLLLIAAFIGFVNIPTFVAITAVGIGIPIDGIVGFFFGVVVCYAYLDWKSREPERQHIRDECLKWQEMSARMHEEKQSRATAEHHMDEH